MVDVVIRKVWETGFANVRQMHVTIPLENPQNIVAGDIVQIKKVVPKLIDGKCLKCKKLYAEHTVQELYDHKLVGKVI